MGKVRVTMRLYRMHDLDLITFIETHELDYKKAVYCALSAFAKGEVFLIKIPPRRKSELDLKRTYLFTLQLDEKKDKEILFILRKITDGKRNSFLKNLLRLYLCNPMSEKYLEDEDDEKFFYEKFSIFREGKKVANLDLSAKKRNRVPHLEKEDSLFDDEGVKKSESFAETTDEISVVPNEKETPVGVDDDNGENTEIADEETENTEADEGEENVTDIFSSLLG